MNKYFLASVILVLGILIGVQQLYFPHVFERICWLPQDQCNAVTNHFPSIAIPIPVPPIPALPDPYSQPDLIAVIFSGVLVKHVPDGVLVRGIWDRDDQGLFVPIPNADDFHQMRNPDGALTPYYKAGNDIYMFTGTSIKKSSNDLILPTPVSISGVDAATFVPGILPTLLFIAKDKNHVYI